VNQDNDTEKTSFLRKLYRLIVPFYFRRAFWKSYLTFMYMIKDYPQTSIHFTNYERYWDDVSQRAGDKFCDQISYRELIDYCLKEIPEGSRVLDFGCGPGTLLREMQNKKKVVGVGFDLSQTAVKHAVTQGVDAHQLNLISADDLISYGHFDFATCTEVLEHTTHPELIIIALSRVADHLLISIPNTGYFPSRLRLLFGRFPRQWMINPSEHLRFWTMKDFCLLVKQLELNIEKIIGVDGGYSGKIYPSLFAPVLLFLLKVPSKREK
jgi:methionine biosynthesis protein MetW